MTQIILKSTIDVEFVDKMGSDQRIVEAMMVSSRGMDAKDFAASLGETGISGRIKYIMNKRHGGPFEQSALQIRVHAPIKVWREWMRHRIGFSYSEESGRYKQLEPIFWIPPPERPMVEAPDFKASNPEFVPADPQTYRLFCWSRRQVYQTAYNEYEANLAGGIDKGLARDGLGVGIFSACYVTCNPRSLMHFLELRTKSVVAKRPSSPLWEINNAANQLEKIFAEHWPMTWELWNANGRMAP
jgi:thymidylate synthase (FAD)